MEREGEHSVCILTRNEAIPVLDNLRTVPKALQVEPITMLGPKRIDELRRALAAASVC